jgi:hypothetical protein
MDNYNEITDLGLAASLTASGFVIVKLDKSNPRRVVFVFEKSPQLQNVIDQFWSNKLRLPAAALLEHVRQLKSRIYS